MMPPAPPPRTHTRTHSRTRVCTVHIIYIFCFSRTPRRYHVWQRPPPGLVAPFHFVFSCVGPAAGRVAPDSALKTCLPAPQPPPPTTHQQMGSFAPHLRSTCPPPSLMSDHASHRLSLFYLSLSTYLTAPPSLAPSHPPLLALYLAALILVHAPTHPLPHH